MIDVKHIVMAGLLGTMAYLFMFSFVLSKPLTNTVNIRYFERKLKHLISDSGKKRIVILAGSNGRFSHRCETIEKEFGAPCTNMSISADLSLPWQFDKLLPYLTPGDLVYLPLEYGIPRTIGVEAPYLVRFDWRGLMKYSLSDVPAALFSFDLPYVFSAAGEMALVRLGVTRRQTLDSLTANGDESGHTRAKGLRYRPYIESLPAAPIQARFVNEAYWKVLEPLVRAAYAKGVVVVGGLPTVFDDIDLSDGLVATLRQGYRALGACFLVLPNESRYPRSEFYDTRYHLVEEAQIRHSRAVGAALTDVLRTGNCATLKTSTYAIDLPLASR